MTKTQPNNTCPDCIEHRYPGGTPCGCSACKGTGQQPESFMQRGEIKQPMEVTAATPPDHVPYKTTPDVEITGSVTNNKITKENK